MDDLSWFYGQLSEISEWRREFHRRPEIGFHETMTAARIAELLRSWGIEVHTGIGGTGVVGVRRRRFPCAPKAPRETSIKVQLSY